MTTLVPLLWFIVCEVVPVKVPFPPDWKETVYVWILAEQLAFVPPFSPLHIQVHGPLPVTVEGVPALQRFAMGVVVKVPPLLPPHAPLTGVNVNVADTLVPVDMVTRQVLPAPEHAPDQPVKDDPVSGIAVSVTIVPVGYEAIPLLPFQENVPVLIDTTPVPVPYLVMVRL